MKSYVFLLLLAITGVFYYCTKRQVDPPAHVAQSDTVYASSGKTNRMATGTDGLTCNCTTSQASCRAECIFSECCLCWNPLIETGACACYFGIAKCKTSLIGRNASTASDHRVRFYPKRFELMLQHLRQLSVAVDTLETAYRLLLQSTPEPLRTTEGRDEKRQVSAIAFDRFYEIYYRVLSGYDEATRQKIQEFIQTYKVNSAK